MKRLTIGIVAPVDSGKTTLSESMLLESGKIRKAGRVDSKDAYLDTYELEKKRGITIFSKQAVFTFEEMEVTLLDTPGHVDFSAEMERTLQVLDLAVLIVSGADGVKGHTGTLWRLLKKYGIPVFFFINKMDQPGTDSKRILNQLKKELHENCISFEARTGEKFFEQVATCSEEALDEFLEREEVADYTIQQLLHERKLFPVFFGAALKHNGVRELLKGIKRFGEPIRTGKNFAARAFKIGRDEQGNRLTYVKITGGSLGVKDVLKTETVTGTFEEKVNQIRIYSGAKYEAVPLADAGVVCALTGLEHSFPGQCFGEEAGVIVPLLEPVMNYQMLLPPECNPVTFLSDMRKLEEEDPQLHVQWEEATGTIQVKLMGEVQAEILKQTILDKYGVKVSFGAGAISYKETIASAVEGVGHYEPLRHYAEVHLLMEPLERGSGLEFETDCSADELDVNWQRLVLTHLREREHKGVLTGSPITDMKITLVSGKAHLKHTEGGDFRQAVYRAVRQGLMKAENVLLEPYYEFRLEVPEASVGRAMTDLKRMYGNVSAPEISEGKAILIGTAPAACLQEYQKEVVSYTKGNGSISYDMKGYEPCHNAEEMIEQIKYDPDADVKNPSGSIFCSHGAGLYVNWNEVEQFMHLPAYLQKVDSGRKDQEEIPVFRYEAKQTEEKIIGTEEIDVILNKTFYANRKEVPVSHKGISASRKRTGNSAGTSAAVTRSYQPAEKKKEYLLVDGYNVIFAWDELKELAAVSLDGARGKLLDLLCNYQGIRGMELIAVFDAYRLEGHPEETVDYHNIHVVYTKEAETADRYIERFAHENGRKYQVSVATSDGLEQIIIRGQGCSLISSRELQVEIERANKALLEEYQNKQESGKRFLFETEGFDFPTQE